MVEREEPERAPKREHASDDPVDSGRQDDRAGGTRAPEDSPAVPAAGEGAELIDNRESDSATPAASGSHTAEISDGPEGDAGDHPTVHSAHSATPGESAERTGESGSADVADEQRTIRAARPEDEVAAEPAGTSAAEPGATVLDFRRRPLLTDADTEQATAAGLIDADEVGSEPLNLSELQADDALLDALGGTNPNVPAESADTAPALESLLVAWRREVDAAPIGDLVDTDAAVAAIAAGSRPRRKSRRRHLVPVASAAAVLMIGFTGVGLAARDAMPGDMLWGVAQVLYSDHSQEAAAAQKAQSQLDEAESLWNSGNYSDAKVSLQLAHETMQNAGAHLKELEARHQVLENRFQQPHLPGGSTSESSSSSHPTSTTTVEPPPPSNPQLPPPDWPTPTSPSTPSSSQEPTEPTTEPSETSGSSDLPSSGNPEDSTSAPHNGGGLFPSPN
ncbi:anti-sigma-D factor RsdA [Saccharopolyspora gregorii]|uniref:Anti-sigma-D factor RsdA sigma factor binding region domain-containing protein n=1 Tax=Saccharopolyspora gregorii TaxID=33914 RepID=A0ABP6RY80_9PSEU